MSRSFDALHRPERGHPHLDRVARGAIGEHLQEKAHCHRLGVTVGYGRERTVDGFATVDIRNSLFCHVLTVIDRARLRIRATLSGLG